MYIHCCLKTEERSIQVEQKIKMDRNGAKTKESQQVQVLLALFDRSIDRKILPSRTEKTMAVSLFFGMASQASLLPSKKRPCTQLAPLN